MVMIWFAAAAVMMAVYVVLDGFDFGAGALSTTVAKTDTERRQVLAAIGPFWDGNEVWLLAGGGVLFLAFPAVLGSALSGFYLAIFLVLWVLILRGISIEFRSHLSDSMWRSFWDGLLTLSSGLAPLLLGVALGNVLRGVPLDATGYFSLPLFGSFTTTGELGLLDWYTVLAGLLALVAILHHGALFLAWKADGAVRERSRGAAGWLFPATVGLWLVASAATASVAPAVFRGLAERPLAWLCSALFLGGLATSFVARRKGRDLLAFLGSAAFLLGLLAATAAAVYPLMLGSVDPSIPSLTALNSASGPESLRAGLWWWPVGLVLAIGYTAVVFRLHRGKAQAAAEGEGY